MLLTEYTTAGTNGQTVANYRYNNQGIRFLKDVGGVVTTYYLDGEKLLAEKRSDNKALRFGYDKDEVMYFVYDDSSGSKGYAYVKDAMGNVVSINRSGDEVAHYVYDAWGNCTVYDDGLNVNTDPNFIGNINPIRWKSQYYDQESGLYYIDGRYYSPLMRRYISAANPESVLASAATPFGTNPYLFTLTNPVSMAYNGYNIETNVELSWDPPSLSKVDLFWRSSKGKKWAAGLFIAATIAAIVASVIFPPLIPSIVASYFIAFGTTAAALIIGGSISGFQSSRQGKGFWHGFSNYINNNWASSVAVTSVLFMVSLGVQVTSYAIANAGSKSALMNGQCFIAGTLVLCQNEDGEEVHKAIEDIKVGDKVWAYNEETGESDWKEVVQLFRNKARQSTQLTIKADDGTIDEITSTPGHKYYLPDNKRTRNANERHEHASYEGLSDKWVSACDLKKGDRVLLANADSLTGKPKYGIVIGVKTEDCEPFTTYNFEVADFHTYYVGENGVCVHNRVCHLDPSDIRYTQDTISSTFKKGPHAGEHVDDLIDALKAGKITPDDIPALEVYRENGKIFSANNRRLFAYKSAGVKSVPVTWITKSQMLHPFTSPNEGLFLINVIGGSRYF